VVFRQVISSRQNITDLLRSNAYIVFFVAIVMFSEAWWAFRIPFSVLYHVGGFGLTLVFFALLFTVDGHFRQFIHWMPVKGDKMTETEKFCKSRGIHYVVVGESYNDKKMGFAYLEDMMEAKLKC
jgi:hypothetical protein